METKFIEGTDQQYSIREDGIVMRHYTHNYNAKQRYFKDKEVKPTYFNGKHPTIKIKVNDKSKSFCITTLLKTYFSFTYCLHCKSKFYVDNVKSYVCKDCLKKIQTRYSTKRIKNLEDHYVCSVLKLKKSECSSELIELERTNIKIKRELSKKLNIHINSFQ